MQITAQLKPVRAPALSQIQRGEIAAKCLTPARHDAAQVTDYRRRGGMFLQFTDEVFIGAERNLLFQPEGRKGESFTCRLLQLHQPREVVASLQSFRPMKKRSIQAAGVEFRERIEAVHVTEVEQPDLGAVVQDISWTEVPFEEAGQQKLNQLIEELPQAPLIPDRYGLALNPRRQQNTSPVARILRIDNGRKTPRPPWRALERRELAPALELVQERALAINGLDQALCPGALQCPVPISDPKSEHTSREPSVEGLYDELL